MKGIKLMLSLIVLLAACTKSDDSTPPAEVILPLPSNYPFPIRIYEVSEYTTNEGVQAYSQEIKLEYNADSTLKKATAENEDYEFTYENGRLISIFIPDSNKVRKLFYDARGNCNKITSDSIRIDSLVYNDNHEITERILVSRGAIVYWQKYTWSKGNIVRVTGYSIDGNGKPVEGGVLNYTYDDKPNGRRSPMLFLTKNPSSIEYVNANNCTGTVYPAGQGGPEVYTYENDRPVSSSMTDYTTGNKLVQNTSFTYWK